MISYVLFLTAPIWVSLLGGAAYACAGKLPGPDGHRDWANRNVR